MRALGATAVAPADLAGLSGGQEASRRAHFVIFTEREMVAPRAPSHSFDLSTYFEHPELYHGQFEHWLPRLTALVNCIYWDTPYPRLVTKAAARELFGGDPPLLRVIGNVSCDIGARSSSLPERPPSMPPHTSTTQGRTRPATESKATARW